MNVPSITTLTPGKGSFEFISTTVPEIFPVTPAMILPTSTMEIKKNSNFLIISKPPWKKK